MKEDIKLSNIKGLLIFLVVFGHLLAPFQDSFNGLYLFIYSFHMPLFILVSGYFAKRVTPKKIANLVMLYLIFQPLYRLFLYFFKSSHHFKLLYELPYYHLWFLVSLASWYLIAYVIQKTSLKEINKIFLISAMFVIGIISRLYAGPVVTWLQSYDSRYDTYTLSYQRTLSFLPFFLIGMFMTKDQMQKLYISLKKYKWIPIVVILVIFICFTQISSTNVENILKGSYGLNEMTGPMLSNTIKIVAGYIVAIIMCYMVLNIMSAKQTFLTKWGNRTMPVFLFHIFITRILKDVDFFYTLNRWILLPLFFVITIVIVMILSSDIFTRYTYYLWHPYDAVKSIRKLFKAGMQPSN